MNQKRTYKILFSALTCMLLFDFGASGQDADLLIKNVREKFQKVKEYEAAVSIKIDVDFVKIPDKTGTIWFMQPDHIKVKTKGFSLLPKRGMNFSPNQLLEGGFTPIWIKKEVVDGHNTEVVKVIPQSDDSDILISTLWIDPVKNIIRKLESTTRNEGTFVMQFSYGKLYSGYELPEKIIFDFDLRKNEIPLGLTGDFESERPKDPKPKNTRGTVTIFYSDYIVNQGKALQYFKGKGD